MIIKIKCKSNYGYFYTGDGNNNLLEGDFYKTTILPNKTTILGWLCYMVGYDFNKKQDNNIDIVDFKNKLINELKIGFVNNSNKIEKEKKQFSSKFHREDGRRMQLFYKEFMKNLDFEVYCYIENNSLLGNILKNLGEKFFFEPGIGDRNLISNYFEVKKIIEQNSYKIINNNEFLLKEVNNIIPFKNIKNFISDEKLNISLFKNTINYNFENINIIYFLNNCQKNNNNFVFGDFLLFDNRKINIF